MPMNKPPIWLRAVWLIMLFVIAATAANHFFIGKELFGLTAEFLFKINIFPALILVMISSKYLRQ